MNIFIEPSSESLGKSAGKAAAFIIKQTIIEKGQANIILATGTSQFETLHQLLEDAEINWSKVVMFHLDEYIGIPITAKASFRKYLKERFIDKVAGLQAAYLINGELNADLECKRLSELIVKHPIDLALVGIGENGHLAFNDPPANFETDDPYIIVELDDDCRKQQLNEGWFPSFDDVPKKAISMSIRQILKSKKIICSVPGIRKTLAVRNCLENPVSNLFPASILKTHDSCSYYLDKDSSNLLSNAVYSQAVII